MSEVSAGEIVYHLDVNTTKFVAGMDKADTNLEKLGGSMDKADQKAGQLGGGLKKLAAAIAGIAVLDKLRDMQRLSEEFTVLSARINRLSEDSAAGAENYQNLLDISSRAGADLGTTVKTWESLTTSLKEFGHSNESITRVTESLMKMGAIGGSTSDEMKNGLRQLGQSFSGGIVRAEEFNSVLENVPEIARQIAKGMNIPFSELRKQMLDGKLTTEVVLQALKKQSAEVDAEFAKMPRTVAQATNAITNEFGTALSRLDQQSGFSASLAKAIDLTAQSLKAFAGDAESVQAVLDGLTLAISSVAAVMSAKMITALAAGAKGQYEMMRAAIESTRAQKLAAAEAVQSATVEFAAARAAQARAAAHVAATSSVVQGTAARTAAVEAMAAADARAVLAEKGLQAAMTQSAVVANTTSIAMRGLQTVMGFLGGPVGVIFLAATALYQFATASKAAKDPTDLLTKSVDELGNAQLRLQKIKLTEAIHEQEKLAKGSIWTQMQVDGLNKKLAKTTPGSPNNLRYTKELEEINAEAEGAVQMSKKLQDQLAKVNAEIEARGKEKQNPVAAPRKTDEADLKVMDALRQQRELAGLAGEARARLAAQQKLSANATDGERKAVGDLAVEIYRLEQAKKDGIKADRSAEKDRKKADAEKLKQAKLDVKHAEDNKKAIIDYAIEVAKLADKTEDYSAAAALAKLNKFATPEDVRVMKELAAARQKLVGMEELKRADPMVGATSDYEDELKTLKRLNDDKLLENDRYLELKNAAEKRYIETMGQLEVERFRSQSVNNEALMSSIEAVGQASTNVLSGLLSGTMSLQEATGNLANTVLNALIGAYVQAGVDFVKQEIAKQAATKATEAAQVSGIGTIATVQKGATVAMGAAAKIEAATTGPAVATSMAPAAGLASIASFGSAAVIGGAALLGTMALAKSFGGGRQYGGSVNSDSFYRINETGPEIFTDKTGKQYMTGASGHVTSNRDAFGGGGSRPIQVIIENYSGQEVTASQEQLTDRDVIRIVAGNIQSGGEVGRAVNNATGTRRPGI